MSHLWPRCHYEPLPVCETAPVLTLGCGFLGAGTPTDPLRLDTSCLTAADACDVLTKAMCADDCRTAVCDALEAAGCVDLCVMAASIPVLGALQCS